MERSGTDSSIKVWAPLGLLEVEAEQQLMMNMSISLDINSTKPVHVKWNELEKFKSTFKGKPIHNVGGKEGKLNDI